MCQFFAQNPPKGHLFSFCGPPPCTHSLVSSSRPWRAQSTSQPERRENDELLRHTLESIWHVYVRRLEGTGYAGRKWRRRSRLDFRVGMEGGGLRQGLPATCFHRQPPARASSATPLGRLPLVSLLFAQKPMKGNKFRREDLLEGFVQKVATWQ